MPLTYLTHKEQPNKIRWGQAQEKAFSSLQDCSLKRPILKLGDHSKPFILRTDASNFGLDAALMQTNWLLLHDSCTKELARVISALYQQKTMKSLKLMC